MMFDGAVAATVAEAATAEASATPDADSSSDNPAATPTSATSDQRQEVLFIDASVKDKQQLLDSLVAGTEVVILDADRDGLTQMAEYLNGRSGIDAIHFISHGGEASLQVGSTRLGLDNIANAQSQLAAIGSSLTESGDFLIYGCDTSKGEQGAAFVTQLANFTGADIAASSDWTGDTSKGGNWVLESSTGTIEAATLFADASYNHVLNTLNAGDIVVLGWSAVSDTITFATLVDIPAGTIIKITDWGWNAAGNAFTGSTTGDGLITWTTGSTIDAGTILNLFLGGTGDSQPTTLTNVTTNTDLSANILVSGYSTTDPMNIAGDGVFIYQDSDANPYFIFGFNNSSGTNTDANNWNTSASFITLRDSTLPGGTGSQNALSNGVNAIGLPSGANQQDNVQYIGPTSVADRATWLARITNLANWSGDNTGSITTSVGTSNGSEINIAPPNSAPVIGNLNGDSTTFTEGGSAVWLDVGSNATVTDADSANFDGGNVTVAITANGTAGEDVLAIRNEGTGAGQISVSGNTVSYGGTAIGTITSSGTAGASLVVTLNASANAAAVQALIHNLTYANGNDAAPSTAARTVSITVNDGDGGTSTAAAVTVNVIGVNDAPTITATGNNPTYTENGSAVDLFNGVSVNTIESGQTITGMTLSVTNLADGSNELLLVDGTSITLLNGNSGTTISNGISYSVSVFSGTATITLSSAAGLSAAATQTVVDGMSYRNSSDSPSTTTRVITLTSITDSGGTANGGVDTTATSITTSVSVIAVNDAPVLSGGPYNFATINEDTAATGVQVTAILANHTMIDADVGALRGVAIIGKTGNGTWQYSTDNSTWTDFGAVSGTSSLLIAATSYVRYVPDAANGETATLTFRGWDQTTGTASVNGIRSLADTTSNGGTTAFSVGTGAVNQIVTSVNDAPVMIGVAPTLGALTDTSINNGGALVSDLLGGVTDVDTGALKGMAITGLNATYGKWQYSTNAGGTWSDIGSVSVTSALILTAQNMVRFVPDGIHGETATITYKAWDQTNATLGLQGTKTNTTTSGGTSAYSSQVDTATVVVSAINDRPVVTLTGTAAIWTEANNAPSDRIAVDSGVTVSDPDGPNPLNATVRLLTYYSAQDSLAFVNDGLSMGNIVGTWNAGTGILTLTSADNTATAAEFQAAMRAVTYGNSSDIPNTTGRTVQFQVTDGGGLSSIAVTRDITIVAVNDSPTISAPVSQSINEDIPTALGSITFSDVDSTLGVVTFSVGTGTLSATGAGGVTVGGTATALTLSGSLANINQFIANNRLVYTPAANASGDVTLTINVNTTSVSDATTTMTLQVLAVNDAPVATVPPSITVIEDVSSVISGISFTDIDAGINSVTATFSVPSGTLSATTGMGVTVGGSGTGLLTLTGSLSDINFFIAANGLTFKTAQDATANVPLTVTINDGGNTGSGGAQTDTTSVTLVVTAVNDAPVNSLPTTQSVDQDGALVFSSANGNLISISDVDAGSNNVRVTLTASNGLLALGSTTGLSFLVGSGNGDGTMTFTGSISDINSALNGMVFSPTSGYNGPASLQIHTNDQGNSGSGSGSAQTDTDILAINVNSLSPRITDVSSSTANGTYKIGDTITITTTFDQVVTVDTSGGIPALLLETGAVDRNATYFSGSGSNTLTFIYTVQAGDLSADLDYQSTAALSLNGSSIRGLSANDAVLTLPSLGAAGSLGANKALVVDGVRPAAVNIILSDTSLRIGETTTLTIVFNEAVQGLDLADFTTPNGSLSGLSSNDGGLTWTATFTPSTNITDPSNIISLNNAGVMDSAGNIGTGITNSGNFAIDTLRPTATIVVADTALRAGQSTTVTITFSEAVSGFAIDDLTVENGSLSGLSSNDGGITWTATLTPGANVVDSSNRITLNNSGVQDFAGNAGIGSTESNNYAIDTQRPTATIVVADTALRAGQSTTVTITFSEAVNGLSTADFNVANGSLDNLSSNDGGITWTATLTPGANVTDSSNLITLDNTGYTDATGNPGVGTTDSNNYAIDTQRPTATMVVSDSALSIGETTTVTITFSESVSGLTIADFTVAGGSLSELSSNDGGVTWTATLTPDANLATAANRITLNNTGYIDSAGNNGSGPVNSNGYAIDTQRPTATIVVADTLVKAGQSTTVTITFSEAVTGLTTADFQVSNGSLGNLTTSDNITYTATLTPDANVTDASNLVTLNNSGVQDAAGNAGVGTTDSNNYAVDTQRPTASIVVADTTLRAGQSTTVTITFSEAVNGLSTADFNVANGNLSGLSSSDGGITWTATLTPSANVTDSTNLISLDNSGYTDAAGNTGTGTTSSNNYAIDTVAPTVNSVSVPVGVPYNAGDTLTFVVNVSENVIVEGSPRLAIDMGGNTVFADYVAGSGTGTLVFQYSIKPGDNDADGISVNSLQSNGATLRDSSGNAMNLALNNVGDSSGVIVDTTAPGASAIVAIDPSPTNADSVRYTVIFDEDVIGVDLGDFSLVSSGSASGTLGSLVQIDGQTFQVTVNNVAGSGTLALALNASGSAITDTAGNLLVSSFVGQAYSLMQSEGDPEFRVNPPSQNSDMPSVPLQPTLPGLPPPPTISPLLPPPLFEVPTLGSGIPTLGNIFINQNPLAPSYIAQVFASSSDSGGNGSGIGFLGFGGGDGGVFGSSSLSSIFSKDVLQENEHLEAFDKAPQAGGAGGMFGTPTLGQQLNELHENEQRQHRELALALQQIAAAQQPA
ncbi:DUF4347 domain-containing protein [Pseudomonas mendocina]|nr:DUF4347 domain-containing protein [Pseudomonas mendocina]